MASTMITLVVGALVLLIVYLVKKYTYWRRHGIPTAKGIVPLVGNILPILMVRDSMHTFTTNLYNDNKGRSMVGYYKLLKPTLLVREPELVKTVLQTHFSNFHDNGFKLRKDLDPLMAWHPFFNTGETWIRARKRMTYAFSGAKLKTLYVAVNGVCKKFDDYLQRRLTSSKTYEAELKQLFSKFTGEVVANAGLGIEGYCFEDKKHPGAFDVMSDAIFGQSWRQTMLINILEVTELRNTLGISIVPKHFDQLFRGIVKENMEIRRKDPTPRHDYLQVMMDHDKTEMEDINMEAVTAEALSFYVDGLETSSVTLSFVGYRLATHPDVQEKLREEVQSTIAKHGGTLTFDALKEMTYMDQVISESQRLHSAAGFLKKQCTDAIELQGSDGLTYRVEPGTEIIIPVDGLHRDPEYWPDAKVFDPERFNDERKQSITKMAYIPFGEGPRMCVGMRMALLQMKSCLATLLNKYRLELSSKTQLPLKLSPNSFLATPAGGIWANISKI